MEEAEVLVSNAAIRNVTNSYIQYRPAEFVKKSSYVEDSDEDESTVGKLPPEESDEEA